MARNPEKKPSSPLVLRSVCRQMSSGGVRHPGPEGHRHDGHRALLHLHLPHALHHTLPSSPPRLRDALSYELHVRPDPTPAIVDIIRHFRWRHIHYLYDSDEGRGGWVVVPWVFCSCSLGCFFAIVSATVTACATRMKVGVFELAGGF